MKDEVSSVKGDLRLQVAGKRMVSFAGADLMRMADVLTTAAAVLVRQGDFRSDIKAWKFVCAWNHRQVDRAAVELGKRMKPAMESSAEWLSVADALMTTLDEIDPNGGHSVGIPDLVAAEEWGTVGKMIGEHTADELRRRVDATNVARELSERKAQIEAVEAMLLEPVAVEVALVAWNRVPGGLSGGYLRELGWMFTELPAGLQALVDDGKAGRKGVDFAVASA